MPTAMDTATALCFESNRTAELWSRLFPDLASSIVSIRDLVHQILGKVPADRRLELLSELLNPEELPKADAYLATMEVLRASFILTHDDADFCFSALPTTPRHTRLKELLQQYLDSPLAEDWTGHAYELIEKMKAGEVTYAGPPRLMFVKSQGSAYLFGEIARSFAASQPEVEATLIETWELFLPDHPTRRRPLLFVEGSERHALSRLARHLRTVSDERRGNRSPLCVAFSGERRALAYFGICLAKEKLSFESHVTPTAEPARVREKLTRAAAVERVRANHSLPLRERLKLSDLISKRGPAEGTGEKWEKFAAEIGRDEKFQSENLSRLSEILKVPVTPATAPSSAKVHIVTWEDFPHFAVPKFLGFADRQFFRSERPQWLLGENDLMAMELAGFPVPKSQDAREGRDRLLRQLDESRGGTIFSSTPSDSYRALTRARWKSLAAPVPVPREIASVWKMENLPTRSLSATQLETFAECGVKHFISGRLGLRRNDRFESQYALLFGSAVHLALERFLTVSGNRQTLLASSSSMDLLMPAFEAAFKETAPFWEPTSPLYQAAMDQFEGYAEIIPKLERQLEEITGGSTPEDFEKAFDEDIGGHRFRGKIDRIDKTPAGGRIVLDYKTGNVDFTPEHIVRGENYQALLYWLAVEKLYGAPPVGVIFYDLKKGELRRGIVAEAGTTDAAKKILTRGHRMNDEKLHDLLGRGEESLRVTVVRAISGEFEAHSSAESCGRCDFGVICRRSASYE